MKKSDIYWQTYLNLEKEVIEVSRFIFITDEKSTAKDGKVLNETCYTQLETFSPYLADLLVRCCVQIEAISKELYFEIGGEKPRGDSSLQFDMDCLKLIDIKWETHNKCVQIVAPFFNLTKDENKVLKPLKEAHKRHEYWEKAYQAVKHDRYVNLSKGNVKAIIGAMAALYLLNVYYRRDTWITKYQDISKGDYSLGSSLFMVKAPVAGQLWYGNNPEKSESPYVVRYDDKDYQAIEQTLHKEDMALNEYWRTQPELEEPAFLAIIQDGIEKQKKDPSYRFMHICELSKYRINKRIPSTLSFKERKALLIASEEWGGWIHLHNKHLSSEELTEENIQQEIDNVGELWGMEIMKRFQKLEWLPLAMNKANCRVFIPE